MNNPKISVSQFFIILIISRMFSMFTYKPYSYSVSGLEAAISITASVLINFLIFVPIFLIVKDNKENNVLDLGYKASGIFGNVYSFLFIIVSLFLCVECLSQFELFMTSTIYTTTSSVFLVLPVIIVGFFICIKGIETIARISGFVIIALVFSIILIFISVYQKVDLIWIGNVNINNTEGMIEYIIDNVSHTTEIIPFMFLLNYTNKSSKKGVKWFAVCIGLFFEVISFLSITVLGNYREVILFPFYTVSAIAKNSVTDRYKAAFITLWVFMAVIKFCIYLFVASKCLKNLLSKRKNSFCILICCLIIFFASLVTTQNIYYVDIMYRIIMMGIPIIVLAIVMPITLLIINKIKMRKNQI